MTRKVTSFRLSTLATRQLAELTAKLDMNNSEIVSIAIDRLHQQEIHTMNESRTNSIKITANMEPSVTEAGIMVGFPLLDDQWWDPIDHKTIELHLGNFSDLTSAQQQHLDTHPLVESYTSPQR